MSLPEIVLNSAAAVLLLSLPVFGQVFPNTSTHVPGTRLLHLHYENSGGERGVTTFQYRADGRPEIALWGLLDGSRNSFNEYYYDDKGRLGKMTRLYSDSITSSEIFEYDEKGRVNKVAFSQSDGVIGSVVLVYDNGGRCFKAMCDKHKGWLTADVEFVYDNQGRLTGAVLNRDGNTLGNISYYYDSNSNLEKEYWDFNGRWNQTFGYEYEDCRQMPGSYYSSGNPFIPGGNGYRIAGENYTYNGVSGGPSYYNYDRLGRMASKKFVRDDGFQTENKYFYDAKGLLTQARRTYADGKSAVITYEFNADGYMIRRTLKRTDGVSTDEIIKYDNKGRMISAVYDNVDTWLTGTLNFEHHADDRIAKGVFKSENYSADLNFEYDAKKNLISITWQFSFGEYQKYTFEYEKEQ